MMKQEIEKIILNSIVLPFALKIFKQDQETFKSFKVGNVYLDKLDAVIEQLQHDINYVKRQLITVHHIDVKLLDKNDEVVRYECRKNNEPGIVEFTPEELRNLTGEVMRKYLYGDKATPFERKQRIFGIQN